MSDQQAQPQPSPMVAAPSIEQVQEALLHAVDMCARSSGASSDIREVREYGGAALAFAQAYVVLDPTLVSPQGVTPDRIAATVPKPPAPTAKGLNA